MKLFVLRLSAALADNIDLRVFSNRIGRVIVRLVTDYGIGTVRCAAIRMLSPFSRLGSACFRNGLLGGILRPYHRAGASQSPSLLDVVDAVGAVCDSFRPFEIMM
jgi:hypothetical protein